MNSSGGSHIEIPGVTTTGQFASITAELERDPAFGLVVDRPLGLAARTAALAGVRAAHELLTTEHVGLSWPLEGHIGDPHSPIDTLVHLAVERSLYESLPRVLVVGEEVHRSVFLAEGDLLAVVDPVDGTWPAEHLLDGHSTVVVLYRHVGGRLHPAAAAIATATHRVAWLDEHGAVWTGSAWSPAEHDVPVFRPRSSDGTLSVAIVGAKPSARARLLEVATSRPDVGLVNLGGTPTIAGLLQGHLHLVVAPEPQSPWDAAHLLIAAHAGVAGVLLAEPDRLLDLDRVGDLFRDPRVQGTADPKTIPPFVLGTDPDHALDAARRWAA